MLGVPTSPLHVIGCDSARKWEKMDVFPSKLCHLSPRPPFLEDGCPPGQASSPSCPCPGCVCAPQPRQQLQMAWLFNILSASATTKNPQSSFISAFPQPTGMESLPRVIFSQDDSSQSPQLNSPLQQQSHPELSLPSDRDGIKGFCSQRAQLSSAHPCQCLATATELLKLCQVSSCHKSLCIPQPSQGKKKNIGDLSGSLSPKGSPVS